MAVTGTDPRPPVPWRTIWATIFSVAVTLAGYFLLHELTRIVTWLVVAGFFAVILTPPVDFLVRRARFRRALATLTVFVIGVGLITAMLYAFIRPIVDQSQEFADNLPRYVAEARAGEGPLGDLVQRYDLDRRLEEARPRLQAALNRLGENSLTILAGVGNAVAATLTILVLAFLMILGAPDIARSATNVLPAERRERARRVAGDCARAVTGYMFGNLVISLIAGLATFVFLLVADVPFREVLALWVGFADLIPLVGATLGAVPTVLVAFLHSTPAGIAAIVFFVLYQQFENHVLQVTVMSRTVNLNPLVVLVSVLCGVELFGILGALLAIPAAGVIQVIARDLWDERRGRPKEDPTVGADERPVSDLEDDATGDAGKEGERGEPGEGADAAVPGGPAGVPGHA